MKRTGTSDYKSRIMMITAMVIYGTIGIFRRSIPLPSCVLAMARGAVGTLFLALVVVAGGKKLSLEEMKNNLFLLVLSGALIGFNWILLFEAYAYTTVATATLCYYMAPVIVTIFSPLILKEKVSASRFFCILLAVLGMALVSGILQTGFSGMAEMKGIFLGLGAAVLYAMVILINKKLPPMGAYEKTILQLISAAVVVLPYCILTEDMAGLKLDGHAWIMLLIVCILHTGIAYALYFGSMDQLSGQTIAIFSYLDPVVAIILSALLLKEAMGPAEVFGAVLILGSTLVSELWIKE